jgi:hypothetical protein
VERKGVGLLHSKWRCGGARRTGGVRATRSGSLRGEEVEDFTHDAAGLVCLEEILGVGGAFENDQGFGLGSFVVLLLNARKAGAVTTCVVSRDDKKGG